MSSPTVSTKLARIAEQSKRDATLVFTTLAHLMDEDFLTEAFHQLRKDAAAGKPTFPSLFGLEQSKSMAAECVERAKEALDRQGLGGRLSEIADWSLGRTS